MMSDSAPTREYVVVGAGAIGGTLAAYLIRAGNRVIVIDSDPAHVHAICQHGLTLRAGHSEWSAPVSAFLPESAPLASVRRVLLSVKGVGATERASEWIRPRLAEDGFVVCLQNGLQFQRVAERLGVGRTVGAFVDFFADLIAPGVIADGGSGALRIGELDGNHSRRVDEVVADLKVWGPAESTTNILGFLWSKLGFSAMLAATALADASMAELIDRHWEVMVSLAIEVFRVAAVQRVILEPFDAFDPVGLLGNRRQQRAAIECLSAWLRCQSKTRSGVWRDIAVHRRATEATGRYTELVAAAQRVGIRCPNLESLVELLGECERGEREMAELNLQLLRERALVAGTRS